MKPRTAAVALTTAIIVAIASPSAALAQQAPADPPKDEPKEKPAEPDLPPGILAPKPDPDAPPATPAKPEEPIDEATGKTLPDEAIVDEQRAPQEQKEPFCISCALIGIGAVILIGTIPLAAQIESASRKKSELGLWVHDQGEGADLGFIAGYGFAKAEEDQLKYGVATGIVGGVGVIVLGIGIGIVAYEGGFTKGPEDKRLKKRASNVFVLPAITSDYAGLVGGGDF